MEHLKFANPHPSITVIAKHTAVERAPMSEYMGPPQTNWFPPLSATREEMKAIVEHWYRAVTAPKDAP